MRTARHPAGRSVVVREFRVRETVEEVGEMVLIQSKTLDVKDPAFRAAVKDAEKTLATYPEVTKLRSPLGAGSAGLVSEDRHSVMIQYTPKGTYDEAVLYDKLVAPPTGGRPRRDRRADRPVDRQGRRRGDPGRSRQGRHDLDPADDHHPLSAGSLVQRSCRCSSRSPPSPPRSASSASPARSSRPARTSWRSSCSSASPSAWTTRCSTCAASARSGPPAAAKALPSRPRPRRRVTPCSSRA